MTKRFPRLDHKSIFSSECIKALTEKKTSAAVSIATVESCKKPLSRIDFCFQLNKQKTSEIECEGKHFFLSPRGASV